MPQAGAVPGMGTNDIIGQLMQTSRESSAGIDEAARKIEESRARETAARGAQAAALAPKREQLRTTLAAAPEVPEPQALPSAPQMPGVDSEQMGQTLSLITALAAMGGLLTRQPLTTALDNFSAGVQGFVQGNQQVFQNNIKLFEENLKKANAENDSAWRKYQAAREKHGNDIQALQTEMSLIAAETQNPIDLELAKRGDIVSLLNLAEKRNANFAKTLEGVSRIQESAAAHAETARHNRATEALAQQKAGAATGKGAISPETARTMAWDFLIRGHNPPARGGEYAAAMNEVAKIAEENGMTTQQLVSASADVKTKLMAKRSFEIRAQNIGRAENQLLQEIPVMEDAMKNLDLPSLPVAARGKIALLRQMGDPAVTKLDQAASAVFNEFEGIITGNPGTLNVQDVQQAKHAYEQAQTPQQMRAAIEGMRRIITNAKKANEITRTEIMEGIDRSVNPGRRKDDQPRAFATEAEAEAANLPPGTRITIGGVTGTWR